MIDNTAEVFIMRDFEVDAYVGLALEYLKHNPPEGVEMRIPGLPGAAEQGHLVENILNPEISAANYVIAFMDTPNANVGYELGYALGTSRQVALVSAAADLPVWLNKAPMSGYLVVLGAELAKLQRIIRRREYISVDTSRLSSTGDGTRRGTDVLFLAPRGGEGAVGHALVQKNYATWRIPQPTGWNLEDLPQQMLNVGEVVWLITPYAPGMDRRDGQENALNAIIAGYAAGVGIPLRILKSTRHRTIADVQQSAVPFTHLNELEKLLQEAEEKRRVGVKKAERELGVPQPPTTTQTDASTRSTNWYEMGQDRGRGVGLIHTGASLATCILIAPDVIMTPSHVADHMSQTPGASAAPPEVRFEMLEERRRITEKIWISPVSDLDFTLLRLDRPVFDPTAPLRLSTTISLGTGSQAIVCGHPRGGALSFSLEGAAVISMDARSIQYRTPTEPGSSGSAVFDEAFNLIAMHRLKTSDDIGPVGVGVRTDAIARALMADPAVAGLVE